MSDAVQQIKDRLNIIDVVSSYVELHKAGKHFKGKSPFTNEKTPSFYVSPERGMYYCFSTSQGGDMFTFIQVMEGVDFKGALKILADKARVELIPISPEKQSERDRLYALLEAVTVFYQDELRKNDVAMAYLKERGVLADTIASWRIGYAPGPPQAGWRTTKEYLLKQGFTVTEIVKAGIAKETSDGKEPYDVFRNRVMFPLFDQGGRVVAFSGRTLEKGPDIPKYVNSPETELYKKSELLYGYDRAKHGIRHLDFSLLVEGQFDVVMSHQAGYNNTVAVSGTALTLQHVQLLERLSSRVVLALDSDKAGIAAAKRAADIMLRRGLDVKVALLTLKDPADIVKEDPKEFKRIIGHSVHVIEWLMQHLKGLNLDPRTLKLRAREEVIPYIPLLPNRIDQDHFEQVVADLLGTTKDAVHYEVERLSDTVPANTEQSRQDSGTKETTIKNEDVPQRRDRLTTYLFGILPLFEDAAHQSLAAALESVLGEPVSEREAKIDMSAKAEVLFKAESMLESQPRLIFLSEVVHALNQLRTLIVRQELGEAKAMLEQAEMEGNEATISELLLTIQRLQRKLQEPPYTLAMLGS
jgi:DNA primase